MYSYSGNEPLFFVYGNGNSCGISNVSLLFNILNVNSFFESSIISIVKF